MKQLTLRRAEEADCKLYWEWANEPTTRQASFSSEPIPWEKHVDWFRAKRTDPDCVLFVTEEEGEPVGQVRFERDGEEQATISISLDPKRRGQGLGSRLIERATAAYLENSPMKRIHAYVRSGNEASARAFIKAGYAESVAVRIKGQEARHFVFVKDAPRRERASALFVVNSLGGVRKALARKGPGPFRYLVFQDYLYPRESQALAAAGGSKIDVVELFSEINQGFRDDFVEWMGRLNAARDPEFWLRLNLAGKSALSSRLCERVFYCVCLSRALEDFSEDLVVLYDDAAVVRQAGENAKGRAVHDLRSVDQVRRILTERLPGKIIRRLGIVLGRKLKSGFARPDGPRRRLVLVKTAVAEGSFPPDGGYRDGYFGKLLDFLRGQGKELLVLGLVLNGYHKLLEYAKKPGAAPLFSIEQTLGWGDVLACFWRAFRMFYSEEAPPRAAPLFRGSDMRGIVHESVMDELRSAQYVINLLSERATENVLRRHDVERFILPYENRGWERADIRLFRARSPRTRIVGYQHAAITPKHTEYFRAEGDATPLPDVVVSMGEATARILVELGGYPSGSVKAGCALRQEGAYVSPPRRAQPGNVLVLLSTSLDYYERTIDALNDIFRNSRYSVRLRTHPLIPMGKPIESKITFPYSKDRFPSAEAAIDWADVALYSSSTTLAFNCLQRGKPVIHVPVNDYLDSDPLFELWEFKWAARTAEEFEKAMAEIIAMGEDEWRAKLARAQDYVRRTFGPVSEAAMRPFLS